MYEPIDGGYISKDVKYDSTLLKNVFDSESAESLHKKAIKILNERPHFEAAFSAWPSIKEEGK